MTRSILVLAFLCSVVSAQSRVLNLNGTSSYAFAVVIGGFNPNQLTVEAWIRPGEVSPGGPLRETRIVNKGSETFQALLDGWFSLVYIENGAPGASSGTLRFTVYLGAGIPTDRVRLDSLGTYGPNQWVHVAGTFNNSTGVAQLYVNGVLENSTTTSLSGASLLGQTMTSTPQPVAFGAVPFPSALASTAFRGQIDEVRVWTVERSPTEILSNLANEIFSGTGLYDAWHFAGNANGVTSTGMPFGGANFPYSFVPGYGGGAFPPMAEVQEAQSGASLSVGSFAGNGSSPAFNNALTGSVSLTSTLVGNPWDVGIVTDLPVPLAGAGFAVGGQIINLDLGAPSFVFLNGGTFAAPFVSNVNAPFSFAGPAPLMSGQMVVLDPAVFSGFLLSNPAILAPGL